MNGITYNRFNSPYKGDKTKDCALSVAEMDNNFFVLEGRDVASVEVNGDELVINLLNGDRISNKDAFNEFTKGLDFEFDAEKGILTITRNGEAIELCGFVTEGELDDVRNLRSATDESIIGNGSKKKPLGVAPAQKTGQYRPVMGIIDNCGCHCGSGRKSLPKDAKTGDRYITSEKVNDYGFLYGFEGVKRLLCDLKASGYEWDLPTKADWDNMLNAIEPKEEWANHNEVTTHKYLGKKAGQFLKSKDGWKLESRHCGCDDEYVYDEPNNNCGCDCGDKDENVCYSKPVCGEQGAIKESSSRYPNRGIDKYGFAALPAGYADEEKNYMYYTERAYFWTKTNSGYGAYIKRFDFDASKVYQDTMDLDCYASVRLVKKFDGANFKGAEEIFGETYPVVMIPSKDGGCSLWTAINIQLNNCCYKPFALPVEDIECTTRYYINEWNGCTWVKNVLKEGESVVVINAPKDKVCDEYRVIGGVLTRVSETIYNDVMEAVEGELDVIRESIHTVSDMVTKLESRVDKVEEGLASEINRAMTEEQRISSALEQETNDRIMIDNQQWDAIRNEAEAREQIDNEQWNAIKKETEERIKTDGEIFKALGQEVTDRIAEDGKIYNALAEEVNNRINEDNLIQNNLKKETEDRITVDNQQWVVINDEIARAKDAEDKLNSKIDDEIKRAKSEEERIETQIPDSGVYDNAEGKLTLNRGDEEKFSISFSFDFGEF